MSIYADSSFFVSLYLRDRHSAEAERLLDRPSALWLTPLHVAEWMHAVEQHVFWKTITRHEADHFHKEFQQHRIDGLWIEVALPENALAACAELAARHGGKLGTRTLDSLHVACALALKAERFWTFDKRQEKLARAEGLKTI